jgi:hypothetical protein
MDRMSEEKFEAWLKENADQYHRPPAEVPREENVERDHARSSGTAVVPSSGTLDRVCRRSGTPLPRRC